jgi:hypothetical protein
MKEAIIGLLTGALLAFTLIQVVVFFCGWMPTPTASNVLLPISLTQHDQPVLLDQSRNVIIYVMDKEGTSVEVPIKPAITLEQFKQRQQKELIK